jgi:uncharacterized protein (TIGR02453 family)
MIEETTIDFLRNLAANNTREWFADNKIWYENSKNNFVEFCDKVLQELKTIQPDLANTEIKDCIFRINRDVRFSKDKSPYKSYLSAAFGPGGRHSGKIDYYLQLQPETTFLGGGMWQPSAQNLAKFRQEIDYNPQFLKNIIETKAFKEHFPVVHGEKLKTSPKNYGADHVDIELLKFKEMFYLKNFNDLEVKSKDFVKNIIAHCKILKPYIDYTNNLFFE